MWFAWVVGIIRVLRVPRGPRPRRPHSKTFFVHNKHVAVKLRFRFSVNCFFLLVCNSDEEPFESGGVNFDDGFLVVIFLTE